MALTSLRFAAWTAACIVLVSLALLCRLLQVIRRTHSRPARLHDASKQDPQSPRPCRRLTVFLGSGGHTGEMLRLLAGLDFASYNPRTYIISSDDTLSLTKVAELEAAKANETALDENSGPAEPTWTVKIIPRARRVHQSFWTAPFTTLQSLATCVHLFTLPSLAPGIVPQADVILLNGPGSCVPIAIAAFFPRVLSLHSPQLIYIESLARVKNLSLSGKILRLFVDRFFVQWPGLADQDYPVPSDHGRGSSTKLTEGQGIKGSVPWWLARKEYRGVLV